MRQRVRKGELNRTGVARGASAAGRRGVRVQRVL